MSISNNLNRLINAKDDIADAITNNGGTVETTDGLEEYPERITTRFTEVNDTLSILLKGPTLITKTITENGTYDAEDDEADGYSEVTVNVANSYTAGDEGKVVSNGVLVAQTARSSTITDNGTYDTTLNSSVTVDVSSGGHNPATLGGVHCKPVSNKYTLYNIYWSTKTWTGLTNFDGCHIWSDGTNIYYSNVKTQYVLDKTTSTWDNKTWSGLTSFYGEYTWTDGENIYYSYGSTHYVLNKATSTWSSKTWNGLTNFYGNCIWTDGENVYCSNSSTQYVLNKSTSTWSSKSWTGLTSFNGNRVWSDGDNIYYSNGSSNHYILDKNTSTWNTKIWNGLTNFYGYHIWTDGDNIYSVDSSYGNYYILNKSTSTWISKGTWANAPSGNTDYIWTDGNNIYWSRDTSQYILNIIFSQSTKTTTTFPIVTN